ncbi:DUF2867 domain-containing protein [Marilutibacter aestuarii]|uniref:DUF2867 domain-containing protein n=1 Tax=Marilutibacter aestuarii TaxID=1706195 RepID=A0A508AMC5_9GAMM|nr:DUF2867 domain-containing protein [Lysobacter aestuarii]TQD51270.1 DUF2867 domain-containing protein [Lysobacter aestuarii]
MEHTTQRTDSFPSVSLRHHDGGLPVEVTLVGQLGPGSGDRLIASVGARQSRHPRHVDALDEPSARLGAIDLARGDATALYSFVVGPQGHPFHRHAGHRVFTAVVGSGGASLRFSTASRAQLERDPDQFFHALHCVHVPPDALVTVRFGGDTWHQFAPLGEDGRNPVLMALSCHTNELGGTLDPGLRAQVEAGEGDIPTLTELLPPVLAERVPRVLRAGRVPVTALSFKAPVSSLSWRVCMHLRSVAGAVLGRWRHWRVPVGFLTHRHARYPVTASATVPADSVLAGVLPGPGVHEDWFELELPAGSLPVARAADAMTAVLEGFLDNQAATVSGLMALRNVLVKPLGLRTSSIGCPASSLLGRPDGARLFAGRFPVLDSRNSQDGACVQVLLGADDRHLAFRSCVRVQRATDGRLRVGLGTRVRPVNAFGRFYMAVIKRVHRHYIAPTMLRSAVAHAVRTRASQPLPGLAASRGMDGGVPDAWENG